MIEEYGGFALSSLAVLGASGQFFPNQLEAIILMGAVIVVVSSILWSFLYRRGIHIFFSALFSALYIFFAILYFQAQNLIGILAGYAYFFFAISVMIYTIGDITENEKHS